MIKKIFFALLIFASFSFAPQQQGAVKIGKLKYSGGGDWYANPTSLPNLIAFCNENLGTNIHPQEDVVEAGSQDIFNYPFIHMTGHGNVVFSSAELENLRNYLMAGGFLHIDDNYGMDQYIRPELQKLFPDKELIELPREHKLYSGMQYKFPNGLPKIHEHDGKPAQGFAIMHEGRILIYYSYETDLGDGWEDPEVHNNPPDMRQKSLQMGANLVQYAFMGN